MMPRRIEAIVEGAGEQRALPTLIKRIAAQVAPGKPVEPGQGWRIPRNHIIQNDDEMQRVINVLAKSVKATGGGILVLWDADDDCPAHEGPRHQVRLQALRPDIPIRVVIANREYEAWFLAGARDLAGNSGLPADLADHPAPEQPRDAKGWLRQAMRSGATYRETLHQESFSRLIAIDRVQRRSPSFDKLCREVGRLLA